MTTDISTIEQELTAAIKLTVPDVYIRVCGVCQYIHDGDRRGYCTCGAFMGSECPIRTRSITLEDVLRALQFQCHYQVCNWGSMKDVSRIAIKGREDECQWIIGKPLPEQSEDTKRFLHSLLV